MAKDTYIQYMAKETYNLEEMNRRNQIGAKTPTYMAKETYIHGKRDLHTWQKRPTYLAKETYTNDKRELHAGPKRPTYLRGAGQYPLTQPHVYSPHTPVAGCRDLSLSLYLYKKKRQKRVICP